MNINHRTCLASFLSSICGVFLIVLPANVFAATIFLVPQQSVIGPHDQVVVDVKIDSAGAGFNATQATIRFPKDLLTAQTPDKKDSAFSFWLEEPHTDNDQGVVSFTGGAPYGISGSSIQVLRLVFTPKGTGNANISIVDSAITSSDGSGTNIVSTTTDTAVLISPNRVSSRATNASAMAAVSTSTASVPSAPVPGSGLPIVSGVKIPLYPNEAAWYNHIGPFAVSWTLPPDVSGVNTVIDRQSNTDLPEKSAGIFDSENFDALSDGVWYIHIRFKNNIGWGPTLHRRIAVDTVPPVSFKLSGADNKDLTTPTFALQFKATDALSGLNQYTITVDGVDMETIPAAGFSGSHITPPIEPGYHNLEVKASDMAGNSVISSIPVRVDPIMSPVILFTPDQIYTNNRGVSVKGTGLASSTILFKIMLGDVVFDSGSTNVDENGNWSFKSSQELPADIFTVDVQNRDDRGAISNSVTSPPITVIEKPIVQFGMFSLGVKGALFLFLLILLGGGIGGWWLYHIRQGILLMRLRSTEADMEKIFNMMRADLDKLHKSSELSGGDKLITQHLRANLDKFEKYMCTEIEQVNK